MNCCSVKSRSTPVSGSGVRFAVKLTPQGPDQAVSVGEAAAVHGCASFAGASMRMSCGWPESARFMSGAGRSGPMTSGVWQSWQRPMVTRYSPRFTCAALASLWARAAPGSSRAAASRINRARLMSWLLLWSVGSRAKRAHLGDPSVDERDRFLIGERGAERRHLQGRIARRDALHDAAALRVAGLDAQHRFGRLARRRLPHGLTDGACDRRRNARAGGLAQEKSDVLQRPLRVVTVAAVAVEIAEGGALGRRGRRDARRLVQERLRQAGDQALLDEIREIDLGGVGMQRARIAI